MSSLDKQGKLISENINKETTRRNETYQSLEIQKEATYKK